MNNNNQWFKLFSSCVPVLGATESLIYDVERHTFYEIPTDYFDLLQNFQDKSISELKHEFLDDFESIHDFMNQFINQEIGFLTSDPKAFPPINFEWKSPFKITNAILQIDEHATYDVLDTINQLLELDCQGFQLQFESEIDFSILKSYLEHFNRSRVRYIEVLLPFNKELKLPVLHSLLNAHKRLRFLKIYGSPEDRIERSKDEFLSETILFFKKDIRLDQSEIITPNRMAKNVQAFSEAQSHNLGLNRKVTITKKGDIKNHIGHQHSFGNLKDHPINEIVFRKDFQEKWFIGNDKIEICKDCQYRYGCPSNSDIELRDGRYYKKEICQFDPYSNVWN